jgi:thioredoxin reductase
VWTDEKEVTAQTVIIATGAVAKRLPFKGSDEVRGHLAFGQAA